MQTVTDLGSRLGVRSLCHALSFSSDQQEEIHATHTAMRIDTR